MPKAKEKQENVSNFIYLFVRIPASLKPYIPIIQVGFSQLLGSWEFPPISRSGAKNTRIPLRRSDRETLDYLVKHSGKSAAEVITAALYRAQQSKVRPHNAA